MHRRTLLGLSAAIVALAAISSSSPASAQWNRNRVSTIVDTNVSFLTSAVFDGVRYRAMVLDSREGSDLMIEMEALDRRGRRAPTAQVWLNNLNFDRRSVDSINAADFRNIQFGRAALRFETTLRNGDVLCRIPIRRFDPRDRRIDADCELVDAPFRDPTPVPPPVIVRPDRPDRGDRDWNHDHGNHHGPRGPRPLPADFEPRLIQACRDASIGSSALEACMARGRAIGFFGPEAVTACKAATIGSSALQACLGSVQVDSPWTANVIAACKDATIGNNAVNDCVRITTGASIDPIPVIRSCKDATIGSQAFQRCIASSVR